MQWDILERSLCQLKGFLAILVAEGIVGCYLPMSHMYNMYIYIHTYMHAYIDRYIDRLLMNVLDSGRMWYATKSYILLPK